MKKHVLKEAVAIQFCSCWGFLFCPVLSSNLSETMIKISESFCFLVCSPTKIGVCAQHVTHVSSIRMNLAIDCWVMQHWKDTENSLVLCICLVRLFNYVFIFMLFFFLINTSLILA